MSGKPVADCICPPAAECTIAGPHYPAVAAFVPACRCCGVGHAYVDREGGCKCDIGICRKCEDGGDYSGCKLGR